MKILRSCWEKIPAYILSPIENLYLKTSGLTTFKVSPLSNSIIYTNSFPNNYDFDAPETNWEEITLFDAIILEKFLTGKELVYIIELDNGDTLKVVKPEVFKYKLSVGEKISAGIFSQQDLRIFKYPKNLQKEMDLQ